MRKGRGEESAGEGQCSAACWHDSRQQRAPDFPGMLRWWGRGGPLSLVPRRDCSASSLRHPRALSWHQLLGEAEFGVVKKAKGSVASTQPSSAGADAEGARGTEPPPALLRNPQACSGPLLACSPPPQLPSIYTHQAEGLAGKSFLSPHSCLTLSSSQLPCIRSSPCPAFSSLPPESPPRGARRQMSGWGQEAGERRA